MPDIILSAAAAENEGWRTVNELMPKIYDEATSLDSVLTGDYYVPAIELPEDDDRSIGKWEWIHRVYLEEKNRFCSITCF